MLHVYVIFRTIVRLLLLPLLFLLILLLGLRLRLHLHYVLCLLCLLILLSEMSPKQKTPSLNRAISHRSGTPVWPRREREAFTISNFENKKSAIQSLNFLSTSMIVAS